MDKEIFMWVIFALLSAFFAGITAVLSKVGIKNVNSDLGTAIRTIVVFVFAWLMVFVVDVWGGIMFITSKTLIFLVLSGLATGASWLCYFKALRLGDVNKVASIDKSSTVLTMILAFIFLGEKITILKGICIILIGLGTYMMIEKRESDEKTGKNTEWLVWAILSAVFAALTSVLGKIGISDIDSTLGTAIRTFVVLIMSWIVVCVSKSQSGIKNITLRTLVFLVLSGIATGLSWMCYYKALQDGQASVVVPIDKLSILVTIAFSYIVLGERLTKKSFCGLALLVCGTLLLLVKKNSNQNDSFACNITERIKEACVM